MKIACLGWGSLIWKPDDLPARGREWFLDGPELPVEFARESRGGRITLVIVPEARSVSVLWCLLDCETPAAAKSALAEREGVDLAQHPDHIGVWPDVAADSPTNHVVGAWAETHGLDAVVWTALPPGMRDARGRAPTAETVIAHLRALEGEAREQAREYVERTPAQIDTQYRCRIRAALGWGAPRSRGPLPSIIVSVLSYATVIVHKAARLLGRLWMAIRSVFARRDRIGEVVVAPSAADVEALLREGRAVMVGADGAEKWLRFRCPCGCGDTIALNLMASYRPRWRVTRNSDGTITVEPSVVSTKCGSHFWVRSSRVIWV